MITFSSQTAVNIPVKVNPRYVYMTTLKPTAKAWIIFITIWFQLLFLFQETWSQLLQAIDSAVDLFVPKVYLKSKQHPKWFTPALKHELNCIYTLRRKLSVYYYYLLLLLVYTIPLGTREKARPANTWSQNHTNIFTPHDCNRECMCAFVL